MGVPGAEWEYNHATKKYEASVNRSVVATIDADGFTDDTLKRVILTQAEYDALPVKSDTTIYYIVEDE